MGVCLESLGDWLCPAPAGGAQSCGQWVGMPQLGEPSGCVWGCSRLGILSAHGIATVKSGHLSLQSSTPGVRGGAAPVLGTGAAGESRLVHVSLSPREPLGPLPAEGRGGGGLFLKTSRTPAQMKVSWEITEFSV